MGSILFYGGIVVFVITLALAVVFGISLRKSAGKLSKELDAEYGVDDLFAKK